MRLRQIVLVCQHVSAFETLQRLLDLGEPYHDPGVGEFGVENAVFAFGDQFIEIIVPTISNCAAQRFINRTGEGPYMLLLQTPDLEAMRTHLDAQSIRRVWNGDFDDISGSHLHPSDLGGALISLDEARPAESWRWAGPDWEKKSVPGKVIGVDFACSDPAALAASWSRTLELPATQDGEDYGLLLEDSGFVSFQKSEINRMTSFHISVPDVSKTLSKAEELGLESEGQTVKLLGADIVLSN